MVSPAGFPTLQSASPLAFTDDSNGDGQLDAVELQALPDEHIASYAMSRTAFSDDKLPGAPSALLSVRGTAALLSALPHERLIGVMRETSTWPESSSKSRRTPR